MMKQTKYISPKRIYVTVEGGNLNIGDHYTYTYEPKRKQLKIEKSETGNTISKRKVGSNVKPLVDIRNQSILDHFKTAEKLKIEVLEDRVLVTGVWSVVQQAKNVIEFKRRHQPNVEQLSLDFGQLEQAVGETYVKAETTLHPMMGPPELKHVLRVVSLFSGAGFSDYGLSLSAHETLRFELTKAYDYEKGPCETYAYNLGDHIEKADLTKLDLTTIPQTEIMVVTPSCQGMSGVNQSKNETRRDEQNSLTLTAIDAIKANPKCQVFIMENVPDLLKKKKYKYLVDYLLEELKDFELTYGVLNAADYGSPQTRKRTFVIGSKIGKIDFPIPTRTEETYMTVGEAWEGLDEETPNMDDIPKSNPLTIERISYIPPGGNMQDVPPHLRNNGKFSNTYRRLDRNKPSCTLVNYRKCCLSHPEENRIISVREGCRLMGIPDDYVIFGGKDSMIQQVANGVCTHVMKAIGEKILSSFEKFYQHFGISLALY